MKRALLLAVAALGLIAWSCPDELRWQIESEILRVHEAIRAEDISDYMQVVPGELTYAAAPAAAADREQVRAEVLAGWAGVRRTHLIEATVERIERRPDDGVDVWYLQRWDRTQLMDGVPRRVLSERRYRETWRRRGVRWFRYDSEDLGGRVWVDGQPQA